MFVVYVLFFFFFISFRLLIRYVCLWGFKKSDYLTKKKGLAKKGAKDGVGVDGEAEGGGGEEKESWKKGKERKKEKKKSRRKRGSMGSNDDFSK